MPCVIKYDHYDGEKLPRYKVITWCGKKPSNWMFQDAQHAALADKPICNSCKKAIKDALN